MGSPGCTLAAPSSTSRASLARPSSRRIRAWTAALQASVPPRVPACSSRSSAVSRRPAARSSSACVASTRGSDGACSTARSTRVAARSRSPASTATRAASTRRSTSSGASSVARQSSSQASLNRSLPAKSSATCRRAVTASPTCPRRVDASARACRRPACGPVAASTVRASREACPDRPTEFSAFAMSAASLADRSPACAASYSPALRVNACVEASSSPSRWYASPSTLHAAASMFLNASSAVRRSLTTTSGRPWSSSERARVKREASDSRPRSPVTSPPRTRRRRAQASPPPGPWRWRRVRCSIPPSSGSSRCRSARPR